MLMEVIKLDGNAFINILDVVNFLSKDWEEVIAQTIQNYFCHVGL